MIQLLLLAILVLLAIYGLRSFLKDAPQAANRKLRQTALWVGVAVLIVLLASGRLGWLAAVIGALTAMAARLAPLLLQLLPMFQRVKHARETGEGAGRTGPSSSAHGMNRDEAYEILGLEPGASQQQVIDAHRRLMQKIHPDRGGSAYLAAKLNQARDLLLAG